MPNLDSLKTINDPSISQVIDLYAKQALQDYGLVFGCFLIGFLVGVGVKVLFFDYRYRQQVKIRFKEKDKLIDEYKVVISERLSDIEVEKKDKRFFNRLKKVFSS